MNKMTIQWFQLDVDNISNPVLMLNEDASMNALVKQRKREKTGGPLSYLDRKLALILQHCKFISRDHGNKVIGSSMLDCI